MGSLNDRIQGASLEELRCEIDVINAQLKELLLRRLVVSAAIAEEKRRLGLPIENKEREAEIIRRISEDLEGNCKEHMQKIFRELFVWSKEEQQKIFL